mgnify:CR=1 FL=1
MPCCSWAELWSSWALVLFRVACWLSRDWALGVQLRLAGVQLGLGVLILAQALLILGQTGLILGVALLPGGQGGGGVRALGCQA